LTTNVMPDAAAVAGAPVVQQCYGQVQQRFIDISNPGGGPVAGGAGGSATAAVTAAAAPRFIGLADGAAATAPPAERFAPAARLQHQQPSGHTSSTVGAATMVYSSSSTTSRQPSGVSSAPINYKPTTPCGSAKVPSGMLSGGVAAASVITGGGQAGSASMLPQQQPMHWGVVSSPATSQVMRPVNSAGALSSSRAPVAITNAVNFATANSASGVAAATTTTTHHHGPTAAAMSGGGAVRSAAARRLEDFRPAPVTNPGALRK